MCKKDFRNLTLPTSCRELSTTVMCPSPIVSSLEPTTWIVKCVSNKCKVCPGLQLNLPPELLKESITYSLWGSKKVDVIKTDKENNVTTAERNLYSPFIHAHKLWKKQLRSCRLCWSDSSGIYTQRIDNGQTMMSIVVTSISIPSSLSRTIR